MGFTTDRMNARIHGIPYKKRGSVDLVNDINTVPKFIKIVNNETIVDYDVIIIIPTKDRYDNLCNILNMLQYQRTKYTFKIIVLNDCSNDDRYSHINEKYSNIKFISNNRNNGKKKYWVTINKLLNESKSYKFRYLIQIDDDFGICNNFIDRVIKEYLSAKSVNDNVISVHYNGNTDSRWGCKKNWVDGGGLYDYNFLYSINFKIDKVYESRWKTNKRISSGVWEQISKKINKMGLKIHKVKLIKLTPCETQMQKI